MKLFTKIKLLSLFLLVSASVANTLAQVNITQPTGGLNISNDLSSVSPGTPAYTPIGNIIIAEKDPGDFAQGTNLTIILSRPSGWQFLNSGVAAIGNGSQISNVSVIDNTTTHITIRYTVTGSTDGSNSITISGIRAQSLTNTVGTTSYIYRNGGSGVINGLVPGIAIAGTKVAPLSKVAGSAVKLLALLPNENASVGSATGKTGTPSVPAAGVPFNLRVFAVDYAWNITNSTNEVAITTNDTYAVPPVNSFLDNENGAVFSVELRTPIINPEIASRTITATNITNGSITANTTTATRVNRGPFVKMLAVFPGETYVPSSSTGKTGTALAPDRNNNYPVTVYSVDKWWNNTVSANSVSVSATGVTNFTNPDVQPLSNGVKTYNLIFGTTGEIPSITATNVSDGTKTAYNQVVPAVVNGSFVKLQILLPGETAAPGTPTGKTGSPNAQVAGVPFNVTVNAVDAVWNIINNVTDEIQLATSDVNAVMPAKIAMVNGVAIFTASSAVRLVTGGNRTITATNFTNNAIIASTSPNVSITAGTYTKLQILLPGELAAPGTATGKTGAPTNRTSGDAFLVTVNAVDAYWNKVNDIEDVIAISTNDAAATVPTDAALVNGTRSNFTVRLRTLGAFTVRATNVTNGSITQAVSNSVNVIRGEFSRLQVLLPGETAAPGTLNGKTGTPSGRVAGTPFIVRVRAVDAGWNVVTGITDMINLTSNDVNATMPSNLAMETDGEVEFSVSLITGGSNRTITATDASDNTKTANTSPNAIVAAGAYAKLQVLLPNETAAPGTALGKTGTPINRNAGTQFSFLVHAVDAYWNRVTGVSDAIQITSSDANAVLPASNTLNNGSRGFNITLRTIGTSTVTATTATAGITAGSGSVNVVRGDFVKLQILLPGETAAPGTTTGKTGSPSARVAGVPFSVTVNAVDAAWNLVSDVTDVVRFAATNDIYAQLPAPTALVNGTLITNATYRIGSASVNRKLTVSHNTDNTKTASASPNFAVNIGPFTRLLILLPGESIAGGHPNGKTGIVANQGRSVAFNISVRATDAAFNPVTGITDVVGITSSELGAILPADAALVNSVKSFPVTLNVESTINTITATNVSDGTKTAYTTAGVPVLSPSSNTDYFRSAVTLGDWNNSTSWQSSSDNSTWKSATLNPTTNSRGITIRNGNTINVVANLTIDDVLIQAGGQVTLTNGALTVANGLASVDFKVDGILRSNGRVITSTGTLEISNGGRYQHNFTTASGTLPTATWNAGAICEVVGYTNFVGDVLGSAQNFSDFIWNAPSQQAVSSPALLGGFSARNFTVTSTGAGTLSLASVGGNTAITGNYTQTTGNVLANKTSGTQNLSLGGNFAINGGTFGNGAGDVNYTFNGATQSLANAGTAIEFKNVTFNGGTKTMTGGSFNVATNGVLTLGNSTVLNADGHLTILSGASSSGRIAPIPSSPNLSEIRGNVVVQRYITGGSKNTYRTYRMISSPIYDNGIASNRTYSHSQFIDDMIVTGTGGSNNGFDNSPLNNASAWLYVGGSPAFQDVANINTSLSVGKSAYIYYRGDKSNPDGKLKAPYVDAESVVMDFDGILNQQNVSVPLTNGGNLVGNPYASSIDWNSAGITKTNLFNNVIRIWNPASRSYATYDGNVGVPEGVASNIIPVGQGFFVQAGTGGGNLTFSESAKISAQAAPLLMSTPAKGGLELQKLAVNDRSNFVTQAAPSTELRVTLSASAATTYKEETAVIFQAGRSANFIASEDATYIHNYSTGDGGQKVFLSSLSSENRDLVINYMPEINSGSSVKLNINAYNPAGDYQLKVSYKDVPSGYIVKLKDNLLNTLTTVANGDTYSFNVNKANANSFGNNRFSLSFEGSNTTLPVKYASFTAAKTNQGVAVKWSTATETNNNRFEVERAGDDKVYEKLHTELAKGSGASYTYVDRNPLIGNNYYRIVQFDNDNVQTKTEPQVINYTGDISAATNAVSVFPNPVISNFTVKYNGTLKASQQTLKVVSTTGQVLLTKNVSKNQLLSGYELDISSYASGVYVIEVYENGAQRIGQMKLIKQ